MYQQQQQTTPAITAKEFSYIADCLKNEETLVKFCAQGAMECRNSQLQQLMGQMAQDRFHHFEQLVRTLQQQAQFAH